MIPSRSLALTDRVALLLCLFSVATISAIIRVSTRDPDGLKSLIRDAKLSNVAPSLAFDVMDRADSNAVHRALLGLSGIYLGWVALATFSAGLYAKLLTKVFRFTDKQAEAAGATLYEAAPSAALASTVEAALNPVDPSGVVLARAIVLGDTLIAMNAITSSVGLGTAARPRELGDVAEGDDPIDIADHIEMGEAAEAFDETRQPTADDESGFNVPRRSRRKKRRRTRRRAKARRYARGPIARKLAIAQASSDSPPIEKAAAAKATSAITEAANAPDEVQDSEALSSAARQRSTRNRGDDPGYDEQDRPSATRNDSRPDPRDDERAERGNTRDDESSRLDRDRNGGEGDT